MASLPSPIRNEYWHVSLRFGSDVLRNGMDPLSFIRYLTTVGDIVAVSILASDMPPPSGRPFRVWSAASSSGEEAFSTAMLLADRLGDQPWEIFGSDLSTRVIIKARTGHFSMERANLLPPEYLKRFCLKGTGPQDGTLLIASELRARVRFEQVNLAQNLPELGLFDVIFLRNVMIYFDKDTKSAVVARLLNALHPGGYFLIGHTETLHGIDDTLESVATAIYRKPPKP